jgi:hypothetical protein
VISRKTDLCGIRVLNSYPELLEQHRLQNSTAETHTQYLARGPKKVCNYGMFRKVMRVKTELTSCGDGHVFLDHPSNHGLFTSVEGGNRRQIASRRTIRVLVIKLAMPTPCGTISSHSCHAEVFSFQKITRTLAEILDAAATSVSVYNFPVLRIIL